MTLRGRFDPIRLTSQIVNNTRTVNTLNTRVGSIEGRLSQFEQRIRQVGGLTQSQVDSRITSKLSPIRTSIGRLETEIRQRTGGLDLKVGKLTQRLTDEAKALSKADGKLGQLIGQNRTGIEGAIAASGAYVAPFNRLLDRIIDLEALGIDTEKLISKIDDSLDSLEQATGSLNPTGIRAQLNNIATGWSGIETTFDVWRASMIGTRSGMAADVSNASNHFSQANSDLVAWNKRPVVDVQRGINGLNQVIQGVFDLGAAVVKMVNWANDVEASYRDLKLQAGSQNTRTNALRQSF